MKTKVKWQFGDIALENAWKKVKRTIQATHLYPSIKKSTVMQANAWASGKWGMVFNYEIILRVLGVKIEED